ncbi:metalloprotease TldD [Rhodothalassium salexigens]|uniref:metalloprotease TldD n=1 Tax=Rhodothalassium salexigens TaxID=1086 RepID=UPI001912496D|nr:metalloprotease TldD [Rhodothalassium salexigens]MBK5912467.1 metalloprotease TldD [Rhodothalassium salexigens]
MTPYDADPFALDDNRVQRTVDDALDGMDDGELFLESAQTESLMFDDGRLKAANFNADQGFGLRAVTGETTGFAHANEISEQAIARAAETVRAVKTGQGGHLALPPTRPNRRLYPAVNPIIGRDFADKVALLQAVDAYARGRDPRVVQVSASLVGSWRHVEIRRPGHERVQDVRPLVRFNIQLVLEKDGRRETGSVGFGGRRDYDDMFDDGVWQAKVDEALRIAGVNLDSVDAPAGEMPVVLGPGWPGVLLHEAVGHGLEGDFNRKKTSAFSGLMGQRVAAPGVTVVDDGTMDGRRGSLTIDDEGTPSRRNVLIEDGILTGYMQDRMNARLMGVEATGNGRRESYAHMPMPRMTNTFMLAGDKDPAEIVASVDDGLFAVNFGGGQVDITSGKFVFTCTEAYRIRGGKVAEPVKGATLIGNGPDVLTRVSMIGNDLRLDEGVGTCGKAGQSVPAGVGQPTLKVDSLTVGGTA